MNPDINQQNQTIPPVPPENITTTTAHPVNQVTTFSKLLAAALFIILPFLGGYVGYEMAEEEVVEVVQYSAIVDQVATTNEAVTEETDMWPYVPYATDTLRYVASDQDTSDFWQNRNNYANSTSVKGITYIGSEAQKISSAPFLRIVMEVSDGLVLTLPCFIESECGDGGLFKFNKLKNTLSVMKGSDYYYPMMTGNNRSPDGINVARYIYYRKNI
jgi:hypothetical protein